MYYHSTSMIHDDMWQIWSVPKQHVNAQFIWRWSAVKKKKKKRMMSNFDLWETTGNK